MPISDRFLHSLVLWRASDGMPDRTGHVEEVFLDADRLDFRGLVQERSGIEVEGPELGGTIIANTVIFAPASLPATEDDEIVHGNRRYEILFVKDPAGVGHHLEILARQIRSGETVPGS